MINRHLAFLFLTIFFFTSLGFSQSPSFDELHQAGVKAYQEKAYEKARDSFTQALDKDPHNASTLANLALVQFKLNHKGEAVALFRRALEIDPTLPTAQNGLKYVLSQLEIKEIPHRIETYETLRTQFIQPFTLATYLALTALLIFCAGWNLLAYLGRKRKALEEEKSFPAFPTIGVFLAVLAACSIFLTSLKIYDGTVPRGTILTETLSVQAAPGENQVSLFDLHAGFEVTVQNSDKEWIQVTYPGASTGWIPKKSIMITSGHVL